MKSDLPFIAKIGKGELDSYILDATENYVVADSIDIEDVEFIAKSCNSFHESINLLHESSSLMDSMSMYLNTNLFDEVIEKINKFLKFVIENNDSKKTYLEFEKWILNQEIPKELRFGQFLFNKLLEINPACAELIRGTIYDPFYKEKVTDDIWIYMEHNWNYKIIKDNISNIKKPIKQKNISNTGNFESINYIIKK
jgi:hypothetical protein